MKSPLIQQYGSEKRWVNWKIEEREGKKTKVPTQPNGHLAKSNDPATWSTFQDLNPKEETGIIFTPACTLLGIDLDHFIHNGEVIGEKADKIKAFIEQSNTYTEVSPSGTGLHLYLALEKPVTKLQRSRITWTEGDDSYGIELYTKGRFFTTTHESYGRQRDVRTISVEEVRTLLTILGYPWDASGEGNDSEAQAPSNIPNEKTTTPSADGLEDQVLLKKMFASKTGATIYRLYDGDISTHNNDDSAADMALLMSLAFWSGKNAEQMDRLWLASPLGQREKTTKRQDYRARSIQNAIRACREVYTTPKQPDTPHTRLKEAIRLDKRLSKANCREIFNDESVSDEDFVRILTALRKEVVDEEKEKKEKKKKKDDECLLFHHDIATQRPHLLYEKNSDKTFWEYNPTTGLYDEILRPSMVASISAMLEKEGHVDKAVSHFIHDRIVLFMGAYPDRSHTHDDFDNEPAHMSLSNGVLEVATRILTTHTPEKKFTQKIDVAYDPEAQCPQWLAFLHETLANDEEQIALLQMFFGYILSSDNSREAALVLKGESGSGKSTVARVLVKLLGEQNVSKLQPEDFSKPHNTEAIIGKRLNWTNELKGDSHGDMKMLINFIDGDSLQINRKNRSIIHYIPRAKELITANNLTLSSDPGIFRRFYIIPFDRVVPKDERDSHLPTKLFTEASGILNWGLEGLKLLDERGKKGLPRSQVNERLLDEYRTESDSVAAFITDMFEPVEPEESESFPTNLLYAKYREWCHDNGNMPKNKINFCRQLPRVTEGFAIIPDRTYVEGKQKRSWKGLKMVSGVTLQTQTF